MKEKEAENKFVFTETKSKARSNLLFFYKLLLRAKDM